MAMIANLRPATDSDIERLLANPAEITRYLYGSGADSCERLELQKAWHAIHFALNGSRLGGEAPLNFLVSEGTPVGEIDVGYGPARIFTSEEVRRLASELILIAPEEVGRRVDLQRLDAEGIYPGNWQSNGYDANYVVDNYRNMRDLVAHAASKGLGLILYIN
ncbi:MAG TPA: YfbM family protein [Chloroflexota bacterium]|jgi:hypothetical protein